MPKHGRDLSTGLPDGLLLHDRLGQALAQGRRNHGLLALIQVDLGDPDPGGLAAGERHPPRLLELVAARLQAVVRASDTVGRTDRDGFALILPDLSGLAAAGMIAAKILATLEQGFPIDRHRQGLRASLGIALFPLHGDSPVELLRNAGIAAAQAKAAGTRVHWFADPKGLQGPHQDLAHDLGEAIDQGHLSLEYQPQIELGRQRLVGLEALLRWHHPILGAIDPEAFIKLAEGSGQIGRIGKWVLAQACAEAATWPTERLGPIRVAVNLSTAQMVGDDLPQVVARALEHAGLPAGRLELELTERSMLDGGERLLAVLSRLRATGVRLALDDFGTGYASLRHLTCFPLDALKIDRSFVANLASPPHHAIVQCVIELAHRLGLRVTAEGVERQSQLATLQALGCDDIQGHIHGEPLTAAALAPWLRVRAEQSRPSVGVGPGT